MNLGIVLIISLSKFPPKSTYLAESRCAFASFSRGQSYNMCGLSNRTISYTNLDSAGNIQTTMW